MTTDTTDDPFDWVGVHFLSMEEKDIQKAIGKKVYQALVGSWMLNVSYPNCRVKVQSINRTTGDIQLKWEPI